MRQITFTPSGFDTGFQYNAVLIKDGIIVSTLLDLVEDTPYSFTVNIPGTYILSVNKQFDNSCVFSQIVQAFFPVVTYNTTGVDCNNNTYTFSVTLTNPETAGSNVQYGWSLINDCSLVSNWSNNANMIIPADDTTRYFFVRNNSQLCCNFIAQSVNSPCVQCNLDVTGISFVCN